MGRGDSAVFLPQMLVPDGIPEGKEKERKGRRKMKPEGDWSLPILFPGPSTNLLNQVRRPKEEERKEVRNISGEGKESLNGSRLQTLQRRILILERLD